MDWKAKRIFKIENDRFKQKKCLYQNFVYANADGFNNKNVYPYLFTDLYSKYYRMKGYNIMYPMGFNDLCDNSYLNTNKKNGNNIPFLASYIKETEQLGIGYDNEKEIILSNPSFQGFVQNTFMELYNKQYVSLKSLDVYVDFMDKLTYNDYEIKTVNTKFYNIKTNEEVFLKRKEVYTLDVSKISDKLYELINNANVNASIKNQIYDFFKMRTCLALNLYSDDICIPIKLNTPMYLGGVDFIVLNPSLIDVLKYTSEEEMGALRDYITSYKSYDVYNGIILKNPLTNRDIYVFSSYKFDEAIHIGIPSINEIDFNFARREDIPINNILMDDLIVNSDFISGYNKEEANDLLIKAFVEEGMGTLYYESTLQDLVISNSLDYGILIPILVDDDYNHFLVNKNNIPVYYTSKYKITFNNEATMESTGHILKQSFNEIFYLGLVALYSIVYDNNTTNIDLLNCQNIYKGFNDDVTMVLSNNIIEELGMSIIFKAMNIVNYQIKEFIYLDDLIMPYEILEEYKRLSISFVHEVLNRYDADSYRLYLLSNQSLTIDLGQTYQYVANYKRVLEDIRNTFIDEFVDEKYDEVKWFNFINKMDGLLKEREISKYAVALIDFYYKEIDSKKITYKEASMFTIMLSLVCPFLAEEINMKFLHNNYSIYLSEWPL